MPFLGCVVIVVVAFFGGLLASEVWFPDETEMHDCSVVAGIGDMDTMRAAKAHPEKPFLEPIWGGPLVSYETLLETNCAPPGSASALSPQEWRRFTDCADSMRMKLSKLDVARRAPTETHPVRAWGQRTVVLLRGASSGLSDGVAEMNAGALLGVVFACVFPVGFAAVHFLTKANAMFFYGAVVLCGGLLGFLFACGVAAGIWHHVSIPEGVMGWDSAADRFIRWFSAGTGGLLALWLSIPIYDIYDLERATGPP